MRGCKIKTLTLLDLATVRIKTSSKKVSVKIGDLVEVIDPFGEGKDMLGLVVEHDDQYMTLYHGALKRNILWNRCVNCRVCEL